MYQENGFYDYGNASFSLAKSMGEYSKNTLEWEILIDAGHGCIPFFLNHHNRIPEAIVITHPHFDHILGIDWFVQSKYRQTGKKMAVYCTPQCASMTQQVLVHLKKIARWQIIEFGTSTPIEGCKGIQATPFPVYHGQSAKGSAMWFFETAEGKKIVFTGDILFPLLNPSDLNQVSNAEYLIADCNNRFDYPNSNHWSFCINPKQQFCTNYMQQLKAEEILLAHTDKKGNLPAYFHNYKPEVMELNKTIEEFSTSIKAKNILLTHYSGAEDAKHHHKKILNSQQLSQWANNLVKQYQNVIVPRTGDVLSII
jgi:phosphoribosyl 1,2-cyclic phosphodiesterase